VADIVTGLKLDDTPLAAKAQPYPKTKKMKLDQNKKAVLHLGSLGKGRKKK